MKIEDLSPTRANLAFNHTVTGRAYISNEPSSVFYLKTDEASMVSLSSGILLTEEHFISDVRFTEVNAKVVIL